MSDRSRLKIAIANLACEQGKFDLDLTDGENLKAAKNCVVYRREVNKLKRRIARKNKADILNAAKEIKTR